MASSIKNYYNSDETVLMFNNVFNHSLDYIVFPSTLHTIIFGAKFSSINHSTT
ncbi:MAG: hypothetical protein Gaeavirus2_21 [Gaeavirus sp.]|uniref:Uncharacterized protein n=1 Tax=Gaeavirus sp. TaxID=2487767 RepID=A0A3G5A382_9VIRU|nr:MAG: hypothetical protein Gaeavirus2_21 [Gaeavirus sp.]